MIGLTCMNDHGVRRPNPIAANAKAFLCFDSFIDFEFNRKCVSTVEAKHEIDLILLLVSIECGRSVAQCCINDGFDREAFPAMAYRIMTSKVFHGPDTKSCVK